MLVECACCHHTYGDHRLRCPACGTEKRLRFEKKPPKPKSNECALCSKSGGTERCGVCKGWVHRKCAALHVRIAHKQKEVKDGAVR